MRCLFWNAKPKSEADWRRVIKFRIRVMLAIAILGCLTLAGSLVLKQFDLPLKNPSMLDFYCGVGVGLIAVGVALWVRLRGILKDENRFRANFVENNDERNQAIHEKSFRTAAFILLITLYCVALVGGLFYPILVQVLSLCVCVFCISYWICFQIYNHQL